MTNALGFQGGILGFGEETTWGTGVAPTKFIEINSDSLAVEEERLRSAALPNVFTDDDEVAQGAISPGGEIEFEMRYEGMELLLKHALGSVATAEVATFIVTTGANDMIDIKEDAGLELHATVASGTYIMGESSATAATLCLAIKTALEAAGTGTYTVTFSNATKLMTIAVSGAKAAVQILWKTGTNGSDNLDTHIGTLTGYADTADSTSAASIVATVVLVTVFDHTFTMADALPTGLSTEIDRDIRAFSSEGCKINTLSLSIEGGGFLMATIGLTGKTWKKGNLLIVSASNKYIDFNIGAAELNGTIATGTYEAGTANTDSGSLCEAIYDAIVAAEAAGTYTVTYSDTTNLFTITRSAGILQLLWKTGTHGSDGTDTHIGNLIGYTDSANDTGALTYAADTVSGKVSTQTLPTAALIVFSECAVTYGGSSKNVISANVALNNNLKTDRRFIGSRYISEQQRSAKVDVTGSLSIEFDSLTEYDDFRAMTSKAAALACTGSAIKTGFYYTMTLTLPVIKVTAAAEQPSDEGAITYELPFKAYASSSAAREMNIVLRNTVSSI